MKTKFYIIFLLTIISVNLSAQTIIAGNTLNHNGQTTVTMGNVDLGLTDQLTVMYWVKWNIDPTTGNKWANMVTINSSTTADRGQFWLQHNSDNSKFEFALSTINNGNQMSRNMIFSTTTPQAEVWYHIAAVYDGKKMKLYVNGVLESTTNKKGDIYPVQSDYIFTMASWANSNNSHRAINGQLDEVSIWDVALTSEQINETMGSLLLGTENGLVAYYRFDETSGTTVNDFTGSGYNGTNTTINGGTTPAVILGSTAPIFGILPIELLYFDAQNNDAENSVNLEWASASEKNNDYYTVYRSIDGEYWEPISTITGAGNSSTTLTYSFIDENPLNGISYYKLRQTDFDGKYEEFEIKSVNLSMSESSVSLYPNPAADFINLSYFFTCNESELRLNIYNASGQLIKTENIGNNSISMETTIDLNDFANGVYFIQINSQSSNLYKSSFIVKK
jgi:hypothetical protein